LIVCILIPRFPLLAAVGGRRERLLHPAALAPEPGGSQAVGEVSGAAEAFGVRAGMALGEALSRCPELALVTPDAERTESMWEELIGRLESVGAAVEPGRPGEAYFEAEGLEGIWGGHLEGVLNRVRRALDMPARIGAAAARFASYAAAWGARGRGAKRRAIVPPGAERAFLAPLPVSLLIDHVEVDDRPRDGGREAEHVAGMIVELERLGIRTLGELAALPSGAVADRFGAVGLRAHDLAGGVDRPLRPRPPREEVSESLELPEAASGSQLAHALSLLVGRLLAHPARRGRSFRRLRITGRLAAGGGWRSEVTLRQASAEPELLRLALLPRLEELPGPATRLGLQALVLGPLGHDQPALSRSPRERRRDRLGEAVRQARAAGGRDAVLRVLDVDVRSRVPERRVMLTPFPEAPE
jgi:nucleotidyltransferase/DNA polymerase involved in DNA repair